MTGRRERDGGIGINEDRAQSDLERYVDAGQTTFDMADHYGSSEEIVGRSPVSTHMEALTKWCPTPTVRTQTEHMAEAEEAVALAKSRLRASSVFLLQYHCWDYLNPVYLDHLRHLDEMRRRGDLRMLGLCNFDTAHLRIVVESGIHIATNQVSYSLLDTRAAAMMAPYCLSKQIKLLCFGTLLGGFLTGV